MNIQRDFTEIVTFFEWALGLAVLLPNDQRATFVTEFTAVCSDFLVAIKKIQPIKMIFGGGDPFKAARLKARAFKEKWNGGAITV